MAASQATHIEFSLAPPTKLLPLQVNDGQFCGFSCDCGSMQEHPILKRPVYMLHPCRTAEVMQLLLAGSPSARITPDLPSARNTPDLPSARNTPDLPASLADHPAGRLAQLPGQHPASQAAAAVSDGGKSELQAAESSTEASVCSEGPIGQYLAAWFSVFGPVVGLKLPKELWPRANHAALGGDMLAALNVA